jgi:hypothetical protein
MDTRCEDHVWVKRVAPPDRISLLGSYHLKTVYHITREFVQPRFACFNNRRVEGWGRPPTATLNARM